ncbi:hypothetical protein E2R66_21255 [Mucilaginibacter psychrotolerans]|uniref:Four helix bundle protein n=1 Tax=Mucilaginibacter psychrotolerans TaxID=1524096 RepID=A0A4Y8S870_9SPHI|nr:hypothetical protein E2R66_21255 [Mucilaginibacter psychrotolerans]
MPYWRHSLQSVRSYIEANHHLPDVPSAAEMMTNGLDVGEMNKQLMKKAEELTLYLIEKDKEIEAQNSLLLRMQNEQRKLNTKVNKFIKRK